MLEAVKKAKEGSIVPVSKACSKPVDALDFFAKLTDNGKRKHSLLIKHEQSFIGSITPSLMIQGKGRHFEVHALTELGIEILNYIRKDFSFADQLKFQKNVLRGVIKAERRPFIEDDKLFMKSPLDIIRLIRKSLKLQDQPTSTVGFYGAASNALLDFFEDAGTAKQSEEHDFLFYFVDSGFSVNESGNLSIFGSIPIVSSKREFLMQLCNKQVKMYEKAIERKISKVKAIKKNFTVKHDTSQQEFQSIIKDIRKHIISGSLIEANPSIVTTCSKTKEILTIFKNILKLNPRYAYFMSNAHETFAGYQHACAFEIDEGKRTVQFNAISTTRPRGYEFNVIDPDLDNKREVRIWADEHEIVKHTISIDAARNEVSRIAAHGSRCVANMFEIQKEQEMQFLLSTVTGNMKEGFDALHCVAALQGYHAGLPKQKAISLLRQMEKTPAGLSQGLFIMHYSGGKTSALRFEPLQVSKDAVSFRTSAQVIMQNIGDDIQKSEGEQERLLRLLN